jgi:hypothetical protein
VIAARIVRRLVRKIVKPAALWWADRQLRRCMRQADHYLNLRGQLAGLELGERKREVVLAERRNQIRGW